MAVLPEINADKIKADAEKAFAIPLGFASPLWFAYAGLASAGVAYWWMNQLTKPQNLEALHGMVEKYAVAPVPEMPVMETPLALAEPTVPEPAMPETAILEPVVPELVLETAAEVVEPIVEIAETVIEATPEIAEAVADDLTRLVGIGPTLATKLSDLGVKTYTDIASWTADDVEKFDKSLNLMGRVRREDWIGQAKQFADQATAH